MTCTTDESDDTSNKIGISRHFHLTAAARVSSSFLVSGRAAACNGREMSVLTNRFLWTFPFPKTHQQFELKDLMRLRQAAATTRRRKMAAAEAISSFPYSSFSLSLQLCHYFLVSCQDTAVTPRREKESIDVRRHTTSEI